MFEKEAEEYASNVFNPVQEKFFITRGLVQGHITVAFKDGAEFGYNKAKEEMQEQGLALQSDMDKTIEQNMELKKQTETLKNALNRIAELEKENAELKEKLEIEQNARGDWFSKAKGIIRDFLSVTIDYIDKEDKNYSFISEAEQFLKENE